MADIEPRRPRPLNRRERERRAYRLVLVTGVLGAIAVVGAVLAIAGVIGGGVPVLAAIFAVLCFVWLRRTVYGR
jgi:hypothetical protein